MYHMHLDYRLLVVSILLLPLMRQSHTGLDECHMDPGFDSSSLSYNYSVFLSKLVYPVEYMLSIGYIVTVGFLRPAQTPNTEHLLAIGYIC